jgi:predicted nucleic acid-binding protein
MPSFSQNDRMDEHRDKIRALKIALITEKLDLSSSEAEKFWPIYNTFESDQEQLRENTHDKRNDINFESLTESDAQKLLDEMEALGKKRYDLYNRFILDLKQVIPSKKIILLKKVEEEFKRKMLEEFKKRRRGMSRDKP